MAYQPDNSFALNVARGLFSNMTPVNKFGRNPDVDIGTEDIWGSGGTWVEPTAATTVNVVSSSANDTSAGTGARTVTVNGLNGSYVDTTETVTLNGTTPVATANSYVIIHRIIVATAGSGATNAGTISTTWTGGGTPAGPTIIAGKGQTQFCIYQIPASYTGYMTSYGGSYNGAATSNMLIELMAKPFGGVYNLKGSINLAEAGNTFGRRSFDTPLRLTEKTIVKLTATADANNSDACGSFDIILVAN